MEMLYIKFFFDDAEILEPLDDAEKGRLLTAALSVLIETLQYVFGSGCTETEDVILNTSGGAIGFALAALYLRIKKHITKSSPE